MNELLKSVHVRKVITKILRGCVFDSGYVYSIIMVAVAIGVPEKNAQNLMQCNVTTVSRVVTWFSSKCSEII